MERVDWWLAEVGGKSKPTYKLETKVHVDLDESSIDFQMHLSADQSKLPGMNFT